MIQQEELEPEWDELLDDYGEILEMPTLYGPAVESLKQYEQEQGTAGQILESYMEDNQTFLTADNACRLYTSFSRLGFLEEVESGSMITVYRIPEDERLEELSRLLEEQNG